MPAFPYIPVEDAPAALDFYEAAFGADVFHRVTDDDGRIVHARFLIQDAVIMLYEHRAGELPGIVPPREAGVTTATVRLLVSATSVVEKIFKDAARLGATIVATPANMPWQEYYGRLIDPFGHAWAFGASIPAQGE